jgi:hypothetical protein
VEPEQRPIRFSGACARFDVARQIRSPKMSARDGDVTLVVHGASLEGMSVSAFIFDADRKQQCELDLGMGALRTVFSSEGFDSQFDQFAETVRMLNRVNWSAVPAQGGEKYYVPIPPIQLTGRLHLDQHSVRPEPGDVLVQSRQVDKNSAAWYYFWLFDPLRQWRVLQVWGGKGFPRDPQDAPKWLEDTRVQFSGLLGHSALWDERAGCFTLSIARPKTWQPTDRARRHGKATWR